MTYTELRNSQLAMGRYLRAPESAPAPAGVEQRRLDIYRRLVYNNIESFLSSGFPVLRSLYADEDWHQLARCFIQRHACHSPYFLEISQEFLHYLMREHAPRAVDPPFLAELAHYEWVELALDVAEEEPPAATAASDVMAVIPLLSPLAWVLCYQYPVHRIGPGNRDAVVAEPTYLVVYRNRLEQVRFMELNAMSARLLELCRDNTTATGYELLHTLARESGRTPQSIGRFAARQLEELLDCAVLGLFTGNFPPDGPLAPPSLSA